MTVSKNGSHSIGAADPSSDPEQARSLAVAPLRQRMIGDMELAGLGLSTQQCYLRAVGRCSDIPTHAPAGSPRTRSIQYVLWLRDTKGVTKGTSQPHYARPRPAHQRCGQSQRAGHDSKNMIVLVIGKGNKERILPLPPTLPSGTTVKNPPPNY